MSELTHTKIPTAYLFGEENAYSWNPVRGCDNHSCPLHPQNKGGCWAARICKRMAGPWAKSESCYRRDVTDVPDEFGKFSRTGWTLAAAAYDRIKCNMMHFEPTWFESQFAKQFPEKRSCILVGYQVDLAFAPGKWTGRIIEKINKNNKERKAAGLPLHIFPFLTKKPSFYQRFEFPLNCWLGFTAMNQEMYNEGIREMGDPFGEYFNGSNVWYSYLEPLEGLIIIDKIESFPQYPHWIIVGGGPDPLNPEWVRSIRDQCEKAGIPFYFKGFGNWIPYWCPHDKIYKYTKRPKGYHGNVFLGDKYEKFPEVEDERKA